MTSDTDLDRLALGARGELERKVTPTPPSFERLEHRRARRRTTALIVVAAMLALAAIPVLGRLSHHDGRAVATSPTGDASGPTRTDTSLPPEAGPAPTMVVDGDPVRGAIVTLTLSGLDRFAGQRVDLTVTTDGPVDTISGGPRTGSMGIASEAVDRDGQLAVTITVPNTLSGSDDTIPLNPGDPYLLRVDVPDGSFAIPFPIAPAEPGIPYRVAARPGALDCGGPPLEIAFNGEEWVPVDPTALSLDNEGSEGAFILSVDQEGRFEPGVGTPAVFVSTANPTAC